MLLRSSHTPSASEFHAAENTRSELSVTYATSSSRSRLWLCSQPGESRLWSPMSGGCDWRQSSNRRAQRRDPLWRCQGARPSPPLQRYRSPYPCHRSMNRLVESKGALAHLDFGGLAWRTEFIPRAQSIPVRGGNHHARCAVELDWADFQAAHGCLLSASAWVLPPDPGMTPLAGGKRERGMSVTTAEAVAGPGSNLRPTRDVLSARHAGRPTSCVCLRQGPGPINSHGWLHGPSRRTCAAPRARHR
jgi:hypothetical protein